jgi:hypothetical protein
MFRQIGLSRSPPGGGPPVPQGERQPHVSLGCLSPWGLGFLTPAGCGAGPAQLLFYSIFYLCIHVFPQVGRAANVAPLPK